MLRPTKTTYFTILILGTLITISFVNSVHKSTNTTSAEQDDFENNPPIAERFFIEKLDSIRPDSSNVVFRIAFNHFDTLNSSIDIFQGDSSFTFKDDGVYPDLYANDSVYSSFLKIDIDNFKSDISELETDLNQQDTFIVFEGHNGVLHDTFIPFNETDFDNGMEVELDPVLLTAIECDGELKKQNSLFITHLDVVEDPARTYNFVTDQGNSTGLYTFGNLMSNMANETSTGISAQDFIKSWLTPFTEDTYQPLNSSTPVATSRDNVYKYLISPWISKAQGHSSDQGYTASTWETNWDNADEDQLLKYAPFKLTAIANRLDLRGNFHFNNTISNAGETRFIFTLLLLYDDDELELDAGEVPINQVHGLSGELLDWKGMNVIFEYLNIQDDKCEVKNFAQDWLDLSDMTLGSSAYNAALEDLTELVINADANEENDNGSAIGRIRTNEKILYETFPFGHTSGQLSWGESNWQFRQFEIASNHLLEQVSLNNTPSLDFNDAKNLDPGSSNDGGEYSAIPNSNLTDWAYNPKNKFRILNETHEIPETYNGDQLLAAIADIKDEYPHYMDLRYSVSTTNFDLATEIPTLHSQRNNIISKQLRHRLSLNTCQGCHTGETKTFFTMVAPLGYGESANYWITVTNPDSRSGEIDTRTSTPAVDRNDEQTVPPNPSDPDLDNYSVPSGTREFVNVSAFITGRTWDGNNYNDDRDDMGENATDDNLEGLYWVNDPSNVTPVGNTANFFGNNNLLHGFNELERRKQDLCRLLSQDCSNYDPGAGVDVPGFMDGIIHIPIRE